MSKKNKQQKQGGNGLFNLFGMNNFLSLILGISLFSWLYDHLMGNSQKNQTQTNPVTDQLDIEDREAQEEEEVELLTAQGPKSQAQRAMEAEAKLEYERKKEQERREEGQDLPAWMKDPVQRRINSNFDLLVAESNDDYENELKR